MQIQKKYVPLQSRKGSSLKTWCGSSVGLEYRPVTPGVASSSLVRTARMEFSHLAELHSLFMLRRLNERPRPPRGQPPQAAGGNVDFAMGRRPMPASAGSSLVRTASRHCRPDRQSPPHGSGVGPSGHEGVGAPNAVPPLAPTMSLTSSRTPHPSQLDPSPYRFTLAPVVAIRA